LKQILKKNQFVFAAYKIEKLLGAGSSGEVYSAELSGKKTAIKWYYKSCATSQHRSNIESLIKMGPPNDKFLWPLELVSASDIEGFGYTMKLCEERYVNLADLMSRTVVPNFKTIITVGLELVNCFYTLHAKGLCHRDISFDSVYFDPENGDVRISDNDNVCVSGSTKVGILGTPKFMAPEIVIGKAFPNTNTDQYSIAVLLFYLLYLSHPLEGKLEHEIKCLDVKAMENIYGKNPVYIFDPANTSNRPVPGYHDNAIIFDKLYPKYIKDLFLRAFVDGIKDPANGRVYMKEWSQAFEKLRDSIVYCTCMAENFSDDEIVKEKGQKQKCWNCKKVLKINKNEIKQPAQPVPDTVDIW